jgi:hypothetical protein
MFERVLDAIYLTSSHMVSCCRLNGFMYYRGVGRYTVQVLLRCEGQLYRSVAMTGPDILSIEGNDV